jgi:hypothetical protein
MKDIEQTSLTKIDAYSYTAILGEPETKEIQAKGFMDIQEPINLLQEDYFNLMPCVAGKKVWTSRDKMACAITDGGKITITDEAFTELCLLNYWDKWSTNRPAKWTDARKGNCNFATRSGCSVKETYRTLWNWGFLTMQSNSMDMAPNELGQGS